MLPNSALKALDAGTVKINPIIGRGLAVEHMKEIENYVDQIFRSIAVGFPPGLKYLPYRRCNPLEEFSVISRNHNGKCEFDVARSDIYLMEYRFQYNDEPIISRYLFLPFVGQAGTIYLSGSRFVISPLLADQVISVGSDHVFVRLSKLRLTFNALSHHYQADGTTEGIEVVWSKIYKKKPTTSGPKATTSAKAVLVHYLLCKYGFTKMFEKFTNATPVVGSDEITPEKYPASEWVICASSRLPPRGARKYYEPTNIRVAVRRNEYTLEVRKLMAGFFYVVDHFPTHVFPELVDDTRLWMVLLGHVIWSGDVAVGKLFSDITNHIISVDHYLDEIYAPKLKAIGHECSDTYHLFYRIITYFDSWMRTSDDRVCTMYDKEVCVLPFVCYDIAYGINNLYFAFNAAKEKELSSKKIVTLMNVNVRQRLVFKLTKDHGEVTTTSTSGDNMALKITNLLVPQSASSKATGAKGRVVLKDPTKRLHVSIAEVGGAWAIPKSAPDGRSRINPTLRISETGLVLRDPTKIELLDSVQEKIRCKEFHARA